MKSAIRSRGPISFPSEITTITYLRILWCSFRPFAFIQLPKTKLHVFFRFKLLRAFYLPLHSPETTVPWCLRFQGDISPSQSS